MGSSTPLTARLPAAAAALVALAYFGIALGQGGYATTAVAWGTGCLWLVVIVGVVFRAWPRRELPASAIGAVGCLAGLACLSALSMTWADDAGRAFNFALLPAGYAGLLALVVLAAPAVSTRSWLVGIAGGAVLTTLAALASRLDPGFLGAVDPNASFLPGASGRLNYPIGYWNGLAACVALACVLTVWLSATAKARAARAAVVAFLPFGAVALLLTSSRGGFAAAVLGCLVLVALSPARTALLAGAGLGALASVPAVLFAHGQYDLFHNLGTAAQRDQGLDVAAIALLGGLAAAAIRWALDDRLGAIDVPGWIRRLGFAAGALGAVALLVFAAAQLEGASSTTGGAAAPASGSLLRISSSGRTQFWEAAVDAFESKPLTGVGGGNYELYWNAHPAIPVVTGNAHSLFLEALADLGPLGLLLAVGPFALAAAAARRRWRSAPRVVAPALAVLATASVGAAIDWTWLIPAAFIPAVIAIALLTGPASLDSERTRASSSRSSLGRVALAVGTALFAWAAIWASGVAVVSRSHLNASREAFGRGDLASAASGARAAASVEPFSSEPWLQLALVEAAGGRLDAARQAARRAIDKSPGDWRGYAVAAAIDRRAGATRVAFFENGKAQSLAPVPVPRVSLR